MKLSLVLTPVFLCLAFGLAWTRLPQTVEQPASLSLRGESLSAVDFEEAGAAPGLRARIAASLTASGTSMLILTVLGVAFAALATCFLWRAWDLPPWTVALLWSPAVLLPSAVPALCHTALMPWTLAFAFSGILARVRFPRLVGGILSAAIWSFLLWWEPQFWIFWLCSFFWLIRLNEEASGVMSALFFTSGVVGVTVLLVQGGIQQPPYVLTLPAPELFRDAIQSLFAVAPLFAVLAFVGSIDALSGRDVPDKRPFSSFIVVGALLSFLTVDVFTMSSVWMTVAVLASSVWWIRIALLLPGKGMKVFCALVFVITLLPLRHSLSSEAPAPLSESAVKETAA